MTYGFVLVYPWGVCYNRDMKKGTCHSDKIVDLKRIEGQVRGVLKMIDEGRYCIDIVTALNAVRGAIKRVELLVLNDHVNACVKDSFESGSKKESRKKIEELIQLLGRMS